MKRKHRAIALLSGLIMLSACTTGLLPVQAESTSSEWSSAEEFEEYLNEVFEEYLNSYMLGDDGVFYYCPMEANNEDYINENFVPNPGTFHTTSILKSLLRQYPEGRFAVHFDIGWSEDFQERNQEEIKRLRQFGIEASEIENSYKLFAILDGEQLANFPVDETIGYFMGLATKPEEMPSQEKHTNSVTWSDEEAIADYLKFAESAYMLGDDGVFYHTEGDVYEDYVPNPGTFDFTTLLDALLHQYPEGRFAVHIDIGWSEDLRERHQEEIKRLRQFGIEASEVENSHILFAILDGEQLENFPGDETIGYLIGLATKPEEMPSQEKHTLETARSDEELEEYLLDHKDDYILGDDGIIYYCPQEFDDFIYDDYVANPGTFDRTDLLRALLHQYPEGRFAVQFRRSYTEDWQEANQEEIKRLRQFGIEASEIENSYRLFAVLDAEQLENFPVDETVGYFMGLAVKPAVQSIGDMNADASVDAADAAVILMEIAYYGANQESMLTEAQLAAADVNADGSVDVEDAALILQYVAAGGAGDSVGSLAGFLDSLQ